MGWCATLDLQYLLILQQLREVAGAYLNTLITFISGLGEAATVYLFFAVFYWAVSKRDAVHMLMCFSFAGLVNQLLKVSFCVYRPWIRAAEVKPLESAMASATGYSFPSGHVANVTAALGTPAYRYRKYKLLSVMLWIIVASVMFSRNYLGVHTPQDVLVSVAIGVTLIVLTDKLLLWAEKGKNRDTLIAASIIMFSVLLAVYALLKQYPMDYVGEKLLVDPQKMIVDTFYCAGGAFGFGMGWLIDRRAIRYDCADMTAVERISIGLLGLVIFVPTIYILLRVWPMLLGSLGGAFVNNAFIMLFITIVYPAFAKYFVLQKLRKINSKLIRSKT